ncbi:hypothetical protein AVEN_266626-1 [Araneus ventricosus]|uniref:Transposase Tc5 C-terminal domain-containing protein n=1 Tax=Araneus ventricosus TaxID=182803 RepID=A0A4Y2W0J4_ARAVE|nr:hypothetical protein AVEN_266626-1 [Araneus ventricosus]
MLRFVLIGLFRSSVSCDWSIQSNLFCRFDFRLILFRYVRFGGLFWYPRLGWVPLLTCGTHSNSQPNRGYQNRPLVQLLLIMAPNSGNIGFLSTYHQLQIAEAKVFQWCVDQGLIASGYECPKCKRQMVLRQRKDISDGFNWICRVREQNAHHV